MMKLSDDAQVMLLLCSRLGLAESEPGPLTPRDWNPLERKIQASALECPGALLDQSAAELQEALDLTEMEAERITGLLARTGTLAIELERLESLGIWAVTRMDDSYPARLQQRLGDAAPLVLFGAGERRLAGRTGLAIVGSRDVNGTGEEAARFLGAACANNGWVVYSGGARGVDGLAMGAALEQQGQVVGLLADSLERTIRAGELRAAIENGNLTLLTPFSPKAPFSVGAAMGRNRLIYALADYAVVVACEAEKGGTWSGAAEALKHRWVPVCVCAGDDFPDGNRRLQEKGAVAFPYPFPQAESEIPAWLEQNAVAKPVQGELF
jgi:predicted Rossmann fold nucleotide-binding protein DprA/Smf involved in DNA uptake